MSLSPKKSLSDGKFEELKEVAKIKFGLHITETKRQLVSTRICKRMEQLGIETFEEYFNLVGSSDGKEQNDGLVSALTTNVTHFFREPHHFELIGQEFADRLMTRAKAGEKIRLWCAGCSTGQETYSLVMTILKVFPDVVSFDVKILSTDIDPIVVKKAKDGIYSRQDLSGLRDNQIVEHFDQYGEKFQVKKKLKEIVTFGILNLMDEFPMKGEFDVILCRNVAIYFERSIQEIVWTKILQRMSENGLLMIGHSERLYGEAAQNVDSVGVTAYRRSRGPTAAHPRRIQ